MAKDLIKAKKKNKKQKKTLTEVVHSFIVFELCAEQCERIALRFQWNPRTIRRWWSLRIIHFDRNNHIEIHWNVLLLIVGQIVQL